MPRILHNKLHGVTIKTVILKFLIQMYFITLLSSLNILPIISPVREPVRDLIPQSLAIRSMEDWKFSFFACHPSSENMACPGGGRGWGVGCLLYAALKGQCHEIFFGRKYSTWVTSEQA